MHLFIIPFQQFVIQGVKMEDAQIQINALATQDIMEASVKMVKIVNPNNFRFLHLQHLVVSIVLLNFFESKNDKTSF